MTRVRIGIQLHPQHGTVAELRRAAVEAEELGADLLYTWEQYLHGCTFGVWRSTSSIKLTGETLLA